MIRLTLAALFAATCSLCLAAEKPAPKASAPKAKPEAKPKPKPKAAPEPKPKPKPKPKPAPLGPGTYARIRTGKGEIVVQLLAKEAPRTVASFVELARGERPWKDDDGRWVARPFYDGLTFHRILNEEPKGKEGTGLVLIQGGCPKGDGSGGPGYEFRNETPKGLSFEKPGVVAMANSGPDTNGSQFFITASRAPYRVTTYTIFGKVARGLDVVKAIARAPRKAGTDKPEKPVAIKSLVIEEIEPKPSARKPKPAAKQPAAPPKKPKAK